jgi:hypothetical protein
MNAGILTSQERDPSPVSYKVQNINDIPKVEQEAYHKAPWLACGKQFEWPFSPKAKRRAGIKKNGRLRTCRVSCEKALLIGLQAPAMTISTTRTTGTGIAISLPMNFLASTRSRMGSTCLP